MKQTRNTRQRTLVLEVLRVGKGHFTAEEVLQKARKRLPSMSLGTVYRNLNHLKAKGFAKEIRSGDDTCARFEIAGDVHAHFYCTCCNRVRNVALPEEITKTQWEKMAPIASIAAFNLHLVGSCCDCSGSE